jgi:multiple sugar transport system substrate-binding protein
MRLLATTLVLTLLLAAPGCKGKERPPLAEKTTVVFKHGKITGDPQLFDRLLEEFERKNPGIAVRDEVLPASTDEQHQFYVINLGAESADFDVISMDVIWVQEFAGAGWLRDLSHLISGAEREDFFSGPIEAVTHEGKLYAVPWYIDAGLLYYRKDLLEKYGFKPPVTWPELVGIAKRIMEREPGLYGFLWQGKQYEGLVCNVLEYIWSNGGGVLGDGRVRLNSPENIEALGFMRDLIAVYKVTPELVTTAIEEPTRRIFGSGKAVFMRNWPYAWNIYQQEDSPVKGKVGITVLPGFEGKKSASTLGGWQLGINKYSKNPGATEKLVRFLTSAHAQKTLALTVGYKPTRKSLYTDSELKAEQPFITSLYDVFMNARPRPVSPYYMMITQALQPEFSAAITGMKEPAEALAAAHREIEEIMKARE